MLKSDLLAGDILVLASGDKRIFGKENNWLLRDYYTDDLKCISNSDFDIVQVLRPEYKLIYQREEKRNVR